MEELTLHFFPFPHVFRGERREGTLVEWPSICATCDRQCESRGSRELSLCFYGLNYQRVDDDVLVAGVVVRDYPDSTPARRKRLRELRDVISTADIERVIAKCRAATDRLEAELRERKDAVIEEFREWRNFTNRGRRAVTPGVGPDAGTSA